MSNPFEFKSMFHLNMLSGNLVLEGMEVDAKKRKVYRKLFEGVMNKENWKLPINTSTVETRIEVDLLAEAIMYFVGGVEVRPITKDLNVVGYTISSKGYYHYVGS